MAQIDRSFDNLQLCRQQDWNAPPDHPDLEPVQEALLVQEGLHEAGRNLAGPANEQVSGGLAAAEELAQQLRLALNERKWELARERLSMLEDACTRCHRQHRDQGLPDPAGR
jgi:hypothetical protein